MATLRFLDFMNLKHHPVQCEVRRRQDKQFFFFFSRSRLRSPSKVTFHSRSCVFVPVARLRKFWMLLHWESLCTRLFDLQRS